MIKTIFDLKFDEGKAVGIAEGEAKMLAEKAETVLAFLRARFGKVSKTVENKVRKVKDKVVLDSFAAHAATCENLADFAKNL